MFEALIRMNGKEEVVSGFVVSGRTVSDKKSKKLRPFDAAVVGTLETGETVLHPIGKEAKLMRLPVSFVVHEDAWMPGKTFLYVEGNTRAVRLGIRGTPEHRVITVNPQPVEGEAANAVLVVEAMEAQRGVMQRQLTVEESEAIQDAQAIAMVHTSGLAYQVRAASLSGEGDPFAEIKKYALFTLFGVAAVILLVGAVLVTQQGQNEAVKAMGQVLNYYFGPHIAPGASTATAGTGLPGIPSVPTGVTAGR